MMKTRTIKRRPRGGKISLTAFEADWLWMILDTCGEIAADTLEFVETPMPASFDGNADAAWEAILEKLSRATPG